MKKAIILVFTALALWSCSMSIEDQAERQMKKTIAEIYKGKGGYEILDTEHFFSDDSVCIIKFLMSDKLRDDKPHRCEYIYISTKKEKREMLLDLEVQKSVEQSARDISKRTGSDIRYEIASTAYMESLFAGRKIKE